MNCVQLSIRTETGAEAGAGAEVGAGAGAGVSYQNDGRGRGLAAIVHTGLLLGWIYTMNYLLQD